MYQWIKTRVAQIAKECGRDASEITLSPFLKGTLGKKHLQFIKPDAVILEKIGFQKLFPKWWKLPPISGGIS
jgi:hypothetical protein